MSKEALDFRKGEPVFESRGISGNEKYLERIKEAASILWSMIDFYCGGTEEANRCASISKTHLETSVMWAVKAISRK